MERYCINPDCSCPLNSEGLDKCQGCDTPLLIYNRYWLVKPFGDKQIFKAKDCHLDTREPYKIIKVVKATDYEEVERLKLEANILRTPSLEQYGGIPQVKDECFFVETFDPPQQLYCLVMEFIDEQNLEEWLSSHGSPISEERAGFWLREITDILERVHRAKIVHGDINPFNIMLRNGHLVLIDFGIATVEGRGLNGKGIGTPGYMAPEQEQEGGRICPQTDFYALGRTFVYLLTGKHPTEFEEDSQTKRLMWRESTLPDISEPLKDLIDDLMAQSSNDRPKDAEAILQRLLQRSPSLGQGLGGRTERDRHRITQPLYKVFLLLLISLILPWMLTTVRDIVSNRLPADSTIHYVNFSGKVGPTVGVNLCLDRRLNACTSEQEPHNKTLNFDGWGYGETVNDMWTGNPDALWYKLSGQNRWVPSAYINGYPPSKPPLQPTYFKNSQGQSIQPEIPAHHWRAEYFSNPDLKGNPVFVEDLGDGRLDGSWGHGAPSNTPPDNFSARIRTTRYFAPGNYLIKAKADDGIRVWVNEQLLIDRAKDAYIDFQCNYFHSKGGKYPVKVQYREDMVLAYLSVDIQPKESASVADCKFEEPVSGSEWNSSFFQWDKNLSQPPVDFFNADKIGVFNLGSNRRSDGKYGIQQNWGTGSPKSEWGIPANFFVVRSYTHADFQKGKTYRARIRTPNGFQLLAKHHSLPDTDPNKWVYFTSENEWQYTDGGYKDIPITVLNDGKYDFHFHLYKGSGNAYIDLFWEEVTPSQPNS
jgi:serine/threonine protein kinase